MSTLLNQAQQKINANQWQSALNVLLPAELDYAGIPEYDYVLGVALLGYNKPSVAIQVLQRAIDIAPNFSQARLNLASALYEVGDYERAKFHFDLLLKLKPDPQTQASIKQYLLAIEVEGRNYKPYLSGYLDMAAGYDSNANTATADTTFLGFALTADNIEVESPYAGLGAGIFYSHPINPDWRFSSSINAHSRINSSAHFVDSDRLDFALNLDRFTDFGRLYSRFSGYYTVLDGHFNNRRGLLDLGLDYQFSERIVLNLNAQAQVKEFHRTLVVRDATSYGGATSLIYYFENQFDQVAVNVGFYQDDADLDTSPYSNQQTQLQLFARQSITNRTYWQLQGVAMRIDYDSDNLFFGIEREDERYMLSVSLHWLDFFGPKWQLSSQLDFVNNQTNVPLYEYDKIQFGLNLRKTFD